MIAKFSFPQVIVMLCCLLLGMPALSAQIGVGAKPVKGAKVYFDGSRKMLDKNWTY